MRKRRDTRSEILTLARRLFISRGFNGFSYQDLAEGLGIRKASIHYHFPAKDDLGIALLDQHKAYLGESFAHVRGGSPSEKLDALFAFYRHVVAEGDGENICLIGMCSAEWNLLGEAMQNRLTEIIENLDTWLSRLIRAGQEDGTFKPDLDPDEVTHIVYSGLQGAVQFARVRNDPACLENVINRLDNLLRVNVPAA